MEEPIAQKYGRIVRQEWVQCKREQQKHGGGIPDHHFVPYSRLDETNKLIDDRIGMRVRLDVIADLYQRARATQSLEVMRFLEIALEQAEIDYLNVDDM